MCILRKYNVSKIKKTLKNKKTTKHVFVENKKIRKRFYNCGQSGGHSVQCIHPPYFRPTLPHSICLVYANYTKTVREHVTQAVIQHTNFGKIAGIGEYAGGYENFEH